ncbi:MAG: 2-dehydropantoate 2-reductase [Eubacteriales bacterium]|nr:2-dehydropantoate 2-reductase [Eubacteriales bacterium]
MAENKAIKNVGIIGAGSVGSMLLSFLYKADAEHFYVLGRGSRAEKFQTKGVSINGETIFPQVCSDRKQGIKLDLVIITVKSYSLPQVLEDLEELIDEDTILLPLLNGILATETLQQRFPKNRVLYGVMIRTDAFRTGHRVYFSTQGEVQFGYEDNREPAPEILAISDRLCAAGINAHYYDDMRRIQWRKWLSNTSGSLAAVEVRVECGYFEQVEEIIELIRSSMEEILLLAEAEHVNLTRKDMEEMLAFLLKYPAHKKMSMLQDAEAGRPIEIEEYAGTVLALGRKHGIPTPVNRTLYLAVKAREKVDSMKKHI